MRCMVCNRKMTLYDELDKVPLRGGIFRKRETVQKTFEIGFYICGFCGQGQIEYMLPDGWYEEYKIIDIDNGKDISQYYSEGMMNFYDEKIRYLSNLTNDNESIIDIGCATGNLLELSLKYFLDGEGVETSNYQVTIGRNKGLKIHKGYFQNVDLNRKYSAFLCLDLLEHLKDINGFLKKIYESLKNNGVGYLVVPNGGKIIKYGEWCDVLLEHISYFNVFSLTLLLQKLGFEVIHIGETNNGWWLEAYVRRAITNRSLFSKRKSKQLAKMERLLLEYNNIGIWGGGNKGCLFIQQFDKDVLDKIQVIFDENISKNKSYIPNCNIQIQLPRAKVLKEMDLIVITALEYKTEILGELKNKYSYRGDVISLDELM